MRPSFAAAGLLLALTGLCVPADASRAGFLAGAHGGSSGTFVLGSAKQSQLLRHPSRRLLQGSAANAAPAVTAAPAPAVVISATGDAPAAAPAEDPPVDNRGNFVGAQFGFQFNNNVAFIGVAIILGLAVSCFWGVCGVYRRRRLAAHRSSGPPGANGGSGNIPEVQLVPQDVKLTVQPIVVIQPDNESIAYTFRELEPESGKGSTKGNAAGEADSSCVEASIAEANAEDADAGRTEQQPAPGNSDVRSSSASGGSRDSSGTAGLVAPAAAAGAANSTAEGRPAAATDQAAQAAAAQPADPQQPGQPSEAVAALQEAGLLRRHSSRRRRPLGIPQLLEWDLGAALAALDAERAATDQSSLSRGVSSAALSRSPSGALAAGSRPGSFVSLSHSPSGVLGPHSRTPSAAALQWSPSGSLAAGSKL